MKKLTPKEMKSVELEMLKKFTDFCDENELKYVLTYGTLLGAIRHNGFIPWDDDIDVFMPRKDYNKLIQLYIHGKAIEGVNLLYSTKSNKYCYPFAKLSDSKTTAKMQSNVTKHGIWIDVFPVDKIIEDKETARKYQKFMIFLRNVLISYTTDFKHRKFDKKTIPKFVLFILSHIVGGKRLVNYADKKAQKYNESNSNCVCHNAWQAVLGGIFTEQELNDRIRHSFEKYEFYIPRCYDKLLRSWYGDYMKMPPENKRIGHDLIVYWK